MANATLPATERLAPPKILVRLCLLLILDEGSTHGYDLISRLKAFGIDTTAPSAVYHLLRKLERAGLVRSVWDLPAGSGPAKRVYGLTPLGRANLAQSTSDVLACRHVLETFLARRATDDGPAVVGRSGALTT